MVAASGSAPPLLRLEGVEKIFLNGVTALKDFHLTLKEGEFLSLLGPSGCGKSTALRLIAGLEQPSAGAIHWRSGREKPEIGFVFQDPTLMPWATVFSNVWLPLRLRGRSKASVAAEVREALAMVGLADFAEAYPRQLSGGMRMRVSIARALITRPRLLLMDEPFAALDEITRFKLNNDLLRLKAQLGCTIVFVTHSIYESVYLSDRIVVMSARPGRAAAVKRVTGPMPRGAEFRASKHYMQSCVEISEALHAASESGKD